ncbi:hypothetical protein [Cohnella cellulosilytica]|uniref:Uncharacterized protein n=1 Tax=Cohnella cellulosilytica TaxID=986710 RepID=A0ABW2FNE9_9BACL
MRPLFLILLSVILLAGCSNHSADEVSSLTSELEKSKEEISRLSSENAKLKSELAEIKNGPAKMLARAKRYYEEKDLDGLNAALAALNEKHPGSEEADSAQELSDKLAQSLEQEKQKAEKEAAEKAEADKKRLANATGKLKKEIDEVEGITWYKDKTTPVYVDQNNLHVYIGVKDETTWLRIRIQYTGDDWVFIDNYKINVDGTNVNIATSYNNVVRDNDYGRVWEYYDGPVSALEYDLLLSIVDSKKTIVRHEGREHRFDRTVTAKEKQAIKNVLDAYEALGGTPPLY